MTHISSKQKLVQLIEENICENINYLSEIKQNMSDENYNKEPLIKFTEEDVQFMLYLKDKVENG